MTTTVKVRVPATTANMGPGFDCLGMSLDIWNTIVVEPNSSVSGDEIISISGEGRDSLPTDAGNLVYQSFKRIYDGLGIPAPAVRLTCENEIPLGRGLGSSAAAVAGGLLAGSELSGARLSSKRILELAAEIEGHPDNSAAAILGGCRIVVSDGDGYLTEPVNVPDELKTILFVPDVPMATDEARGVLPPTISRQDAVFNIGRTALLVNALASGNLKHLETATEDMLHQPARQKLFFPMKNIFRAAMSAGALGVFLSGAGSSVLALARDREYTIGYEMADAAMKSGVDGAIKVTKPTQLGAHVVGQSVS
ncbi:MAG: homoserine kinase [Chloroflexi bacterium]|nr:homoserine kinase [Chloroflexota bacterium]